MTTDIQLLRSSVANKRPVIATLLDGQAAVNINAAAPGLFFKDSTGTALFKVGPAEVNTSGDAPNANAAGSAGNGLGETWLDGRAAYDSPVLKVYNGSEWSEANGFAVDDTTGDYGLDRVMTLRSLIADGTADDSHVTVPSDTTANRPSTPASGMLRFNTTDLLFEGYDGTGWRQFAGSGGNSTLVDLTVTGNTVLGDDCAADTLEINSVTTINCDATIGANNTNTLTVNSLIDGDLVPNANGTQALGSATARWDTFANDLDADGNTILGSDIATDTVTISAALTQNGESDFLGHIEIVNQQELRFSADAAPGGNTLGLRAPATLSATTVLNLPDGDGTAGQGLITDGAGNLSWGNPTLSGTITGDDLTITGDTILGDSCVGGDTVTINAATTINCNLTVGSDAANHVVNFTNTRVNSDFLPSGTDTRDIGSITERWANVYAENVRTGDLHLTNDRGSWTMIEEETYLSLRNNLTGKTYKLMMEEV